MEKTYEGTCYIGAVGPEEENGECHDSIANLILRPGDASPIFGRGTKGYEVRQTHLNTWRESGHPLCLLVDSDMKFSADALERLRSHKLPYVSGLYLRRRYNPMCPIWFENAEPGVLPLNIWTKTWEPNTLYPIGASGWGCILLHREVLDGVAKLLKGEPEVIEDDMDVYPYDLNTMFSAIRHLRQALDEGALISHSRIDRYVTALEEEFRPLRGKKDMVGSDIRFPFFAKLAGFQMHGDSGVMCGHNLNYPLHPTDYAQSMNAEQVAGLSKEVTANWQKERESITAIVREYAGRPL